MVVTDEVRSEEAQLRALQRLDEECVQLQIQGNYVGALECMERALVLRRHFFGLQSSEVREACKGVAELCNLLSMTFLQQENYTVTIELLKKAEILTEHLPQERATTLNNMACYYRRIGKLHGALSCLKRALEIELRINKISATADTHLNLCAVYSTLGKHPSAIEHAQAALIVLHEELFSEGKDLKHLDHRKDRVAVLCIAYHNIGVEHEYLNQFQQSGVGIAEQYLGNTHGVTITLTNSYIAARRSLQTKAKQESKRSSPTKSSKKISPGKKSIKDLSKDIRREDDGEDSRQGQLSPSNSKKELPPLASIAKANEIAAATIGRPTSPTFPPLTPHSVFFSPRNLSPKKVLKPLPDSTSLPMVDCEVSPSRHNTLNPLPSRPQTPIDNLPTEVAKELNLSAPATPKKSHQDEVIPLVTNATSAKSANELDTHISPMVAPSNPLTEAAQEIPVDASGTTERPSLDNQSHALSVEKLSMSDASKQTLIDSCETQSAECSQKDLKEATSVSESTIGNSSTEPLELSLPIKENIVVDSTDTEAVHNVAQRSLELEAVSVESQPSQQSPKHPELEPAAVETQPIDCEKFPSEHVSQVCSIEALNRQNTMPECLEHIPTTPVEKPETWMNQTRRASAACIKEVAAKLEATASEACTDDIMQADQNISLNIDSESSHENISQHEQTPIEMDVKAPEPETPRNIPSLLPSTSEIDQQSESSSTTQEPLPTKLDEVESHERRPSTPNTTNDTLKELQLTDKDSNDEINALESSIPIVNSINLNEVESKPVASTPRDVEECSKPIQELAQSNSDTIESSENLSEPLTLPTPLESAILNNNNDIPQIQELTPSKSPCDIISEATSEAPSGEITSSETQEDNEKIDSALENEPILSDLNTNLVKDDSTEMPASNDSKNLLTQEMPSENTVTSTAMAEDTKLTSKSSDDDPSELPTTENYSATRGGTEESINTSAIEASPQLNTNFHESSSSGDASVRTNSQTLDPLEPIELITPSNNHTEESNNSARVITDSNPSTISHVDEQSHVNEM